MFYSGNDDDDNDFSIVSSTGGSSKLANLFATDPQVAKNEQSLFYVPPKQPKKASASEPQSSALSVIHALALHAYKLSRETGKYVSQGKLGAAILGNSQLHTYKFILYTGKKQEVASVIITPSFVLTVQQNNYVHFYDDHKENWSVVFDSEQAVIDFAKQVALAKADSAGENLKNIIVQDLTPGEGNGLENGDAAEIAYTGYLMNNHELGQVFDSNVNSGKLLRVKLGKGKVNKAIEEGLMGAKKNGRRFLIVPKSFENATQGFEQKVTPGSTLVFDITVNKVKYGQQHSRSSTPSGQEVETSDFRKPDVVPKPTSAANDETIRSRGASLSEQLSQSPKSEKAKIISRMAKMGMPMLPMQGATPAQPSSDSETEEDQRSKSPTPALPPQAAQSPKPSPKPRSSSSSSVGSVNHHPHSTPPAQTTSQLPVQPMSLYQPAPQYPGGQPYPYGYQPPGAMASQFGVYPQPPYVNPNIAVAPAMPTSSVADTHLPLLLSESRSQNTELRMSLSKLTDKVDTVLSKLNEVKTDHMSSMHANMPYMESSMLMSNIQRIVQENTQLKKDAEEKTKKIEHLNEKICELLQRNQRFMEESHMMMEHRSDTFLTTASQSQARLLSVEQDKAKLANELSDALSKLSALQLEITRHHNQEDELRKQLQNASLEAARQKEETEAVKRYHDKNQKQTSEMEQRIEVLEQEKNNYKETIKSLETKILTLQTASENAQKMSDIEEKLKEQLEKKYQSMTLEMTEVHQKQMHSLEKKNVQSEHRISQLESKLQETEATLHSREQAIMELKKEMETLSVWKTKYENVYKNAQTMKEKYEERIQHWAAEVRRLKSSENSGSLSFSGEDFEAELKKIMTAMYKLLQSEFQRGESYSGSDVLRIVLEKIRYLTLRLLEGRSKTTDQGSAGEVKEVKASEQTAEKVLQESSKGKDDEITKDSGSQPAKPASLPPYKTITEVPSSSEVNEIVNQTLQPEPLTESSTNVQEISSSTDTLPSSAQETNQPHSTDEKPPTEDAATDNQKVEVSDTVPSAEVPTSSADTIVKDPDLVWRPQPPPPPLFDEDEEDEDDWLK